MATAAVCTARLRRKLHTPNLLASCAMNTSASTTDSVRNDTHTLQRVGVIAFATITAAYVIVLARFDSFPFQDFPNHLTRAAIIADLLFHHGATFGQLFDFRFMPVPYILGD